MTPERWARIKAILDELDAASPAEQPALLDALCGTDEDLRRDVNVYRSEEDAGTFIAGVIGQQAASLNETVGKQERFGSYRLIRRIGQGGMGAVYEAARVDDFKKTVALKIIRQGLDSDFARARFLQERQLLATLEHRYIARLMDGGETDDGSPWLVMELVEGEPIHQYAQVLDKASQLRLFLKVCEAVGHAHRNLVIHRDLKPANILITAEGDPKLLDFGIAKLLDADAAATQTALTALTPEYASPEQIRGEPVSTATDVYSLGVVLYQMLTDRKPYSFGSATSQEWDRVICLQSPDAPDMGDELDNILLMALRKEPERRYATVERFADDIERYLAHLPVRAQPDTWHYRTGKFIRRNRLGIAAATLIVLTLAIAAGLNIAEQRRTTRRFNQVRQLANRFLFDFHDEIANVPGTVKAREMIVTTALQYLNSLAADAKGDPALQWELATAYVRVAKAQGSTTSPSLKRPAEGIQSFEKAIAIGRALDDAKQLNDEQRAAFIDSLCDAEVALRSQHRPEATALGREAVARSAGTPPLMKTRALGELAITLGIFGDIVGSESTLRDILANARANAVRIPTFDNRRRVAVTLLNLANAQRRLTEFAKATDTDAESLASLKLLAAEHPDDTRMRRWIFLAMTGLADSAGAGDQPSSEEFAKAGDLYEEAIALMDPLIAADGKDRATRNDVGLTHVRAAYALADADGRRALSHALKAAELLDAASPENTDTRAQPRIAAGNALRTLKQPDVASEQLKVAERILVAKDNDTRADLELAWARLYAARDARAEAVAHFARAISVDEAIFAKSPTPANAWALSRTLEFAAVADPESATPKRQRELAVWVDQNRRFPKHSYIERKVAEAQARL